MLDVLPLLAIWFLAVITPGPDFVVVVHYSTSRSRRHGAMVATGVSAAILLWATGSMLGLSMLLTRLSWLYEIVRLAGAAYLIFLGIRMLLASRRSRSSEPAAGPAGTVGPRVRHAQPDDAAPAGLLSAWRAGFLTNAANPKAVAFFGSLLGAMLPPHPSAGLQVFVIAAIVVMAWTWYLLVVGVFSAGPVAGLYRRARRWIDRAVAAVMIAFGGKLAVDR